MKIQIIPFRNRRKQTKKVIWVLISFLILYVFSNVEIKTQLDSLESEPKKEVIGDITNIAPLLKEKEKIEYANLPKQIQGYPVVGKLEIPKINLVTYVLGDTNEKSLKIAVTKLIGPKANEIGNFCISGHNYNSKIMFGDLKKLEVKDEIKLTNTYDETQSYRIYHIFKTSPKDTSCLTQQTNGDKEITLITCTWGAIQRLVVKAVAK